MRERRGERRVEVEVGKKEVKESGLGFEVNKVSFCVCSGEECDHDFILQCNREQR